METSLTLRPTNKIRVTHRDLMRFLEQMLWVVPTSIKSLKRMCQRLTFKAEIYLVECGQRDQMKFLDEETHSYE